MVVDPVPAVEYVARLLLENGSASERRESHASDDSNALSAVSDASTVQVVRPREQHVREKRNMDAQQSLILDGPRRRTQRQPGAEMGTGAARAQNRGVK